MPDKASFGLAATGIGSVPFQEVDETCAEILSLFPDIPFWPQFVRVNPLEDMMLQFTEGLPLLRVDGDKRSVTIAASSDREGELTRMYERFLGDDIEFFAIGREHARGLYRLLELIENEEAQRGRYIKGQTVGPFTFAAGIVNTDGKSVLHDAELFDAITSGLCAKALWQIRMLSASGRRPVLFFDEPYLSGFGSAFCTVERKQVVDVLRKSIRYLKERSDALIGIHCCGNTDWSMLLESGPDIINFDAFGFMDHFILYPAEISSFLEEGGSIAWGIVPTSSFEGRETPAGLSAMLDNGLERLNAIGLDPELTKARSLLTPACGMGSMEPAHASRAMRLLSELSSGRLIRH